MNQAKKPQLAPAESDHAELVKLLEIRSAAEIDLEKFQNAIDQEYLGLIDAKLPEFTRLQAIFNQADRAVETICLMHPEWFEKAKSIPTPYGKAKQTTGKSLEVENEELTIALIEAEAKRDPEFDATLYIDSKKVLKKDAVKTLDAATLKRIRCKLVVTTNIKAESLRVDMGKAAEEAEKKAGAA